MSKLVHVVGSLDGGPGKIHDDCPLCRMLVEQGEEIVTMDAKGGLVPLTPPETLPPAIQVTLTADLLVQGVIGPSGWFPVPVGCKAGDLLEMLCFFAPELRVTFPGAWLRVNGRTARPEQVLRDRDVVLVMASGRERVRM